MAHQHCRLSIADAIADYAQGLITAKGAIAYWIRCQENQEIDLDPDDVRDAFKRNGRPMSRSQFYAGLKSLQEEGIVITERSYKITIKGEVQA